MNEDEMRKAARLAIVRQDAHVRIADHALSLIAAAVGARR